MPTKPAWLLHLPRQTQQWPSCCGRKRRRCGSRRRPRRVPKPPSGHARGSANSSSKLPVAGRQAQLRRLPWKPLGLHPAASPPRSLESRRPMRKTSSWPGDLQLGMPRAAAAVAAAAAGRAGRRGRNTKAWRLSVRQQQGPCRHLRPLTAAQIQRSRWQRSGRQQIRARLLQLLTAGWEQGTLVRQGSRGQRNSRAGAWIQHAAAVLRMRSSS